MTTYYPVYLNLRGRRCVIVGGGTVAEGKIARLLDSGADICVVSPDATPGIRQFVADGAVRWEQRKYRARRPGGRLHRHRRHQRPRGQPAHFRGSQRAGRHAQRRGRPAQLQLHRAVHRATRAGDAGNLHRRRVAGALARKLRESLQSSDDLAWADLSGVMAVARSHLREAGLLSTIDPQRWQCCITPQLLAMAQDGSGTPKPRRR